jgi:Tat protein translocase TatB subunit
MNSIFGIGVFELIFILMFALIFLGPERLPKVTRDTMNFIRRLQKLSGELSRQVNEEIGDLREFDPSYHINQMIGEDDEKEKSSKSTAASKRQTSAPSQPQPDQVAAAESEAADKDATTEAEPSSPLTIAPDSAASANGRQRSGESADAKSKGTAISPAPRASSSPATPRSRAGGAGARPASSAGNSGVKSLAELRKQQRAKRQASASGSNSSYLEERNKRAQGRAEDRRQVMAEQRAEKESTADGDVEFADDESATHEAPATTGEGTLERVSNAEVQAEQPGSAGPSEPPALAVTATDEKTDGDSSEETQA